MGYVLSPGGHWTGDYLIMDQEKLANADTVSSVEPLPYKDSVVPSHFTFPVKAGICKQPEDSPVEFDISELDAKEDDEVVDENLDDLDSPEVADAPLDGW